MSMEITGGVLMQDGGAVPFCKTPNVSSGTMTPELIVLHDTAGRLSFGSSVEHLCKRKARASAHFVVERDGSVTQLAKCTQKTWHAGKSSYKGRKFCNGFSVGIEIVNPGKLTASKNGAKAWFKQEFDIEEYGIEFAQTREHGKGLWMPYTDEQRDAVFELCAALSKAYPSIKDVTTHWAISPKRKVDPCPLFPVDACRTAALGEQDDNDPAISGEVHKVGDHNPLVRVEQEFLKKLGYDIGGVDGWYGKNTRAAVLDFQAENDLTMDGKIGPQTRSVLMSEDAKSKHVEEAREKITIPELASMGSTTIKSARSGQAMVGLMSAPAILEGMTWFSGEVGAWKSAVEPFKANVGWMLEYWPIGVLVGVMIAWKYFEDVKQSRLKDHQENANRGR